MRTKNHPCIVTEPKPQGLGLPAIYRKAAERTANFGSAGCAIWAQCGFPARTAAAERLWNSFCEGEFPIGGNVGVLGLLLLAEILEAAE